MEEYDKCHVCGKGVLRRRVGPETFEYKDRWLTITGYECYECIFCGESFPTKATIERTEPILTEFRRFVDTMGE